MSNENSAGDPLAFVRNMWGNMGFSLPGMVTPTLDLDELDKRINDLKTVEGWLRMNLSMLQMTIQSMEMQRSTLSAVKAMSEMVSGQGKETAGAEAPNAMSQAAMWPWNMMQQMQVQMQEAAAKMPTAASATEAAVNMAQNAATEARRRQPE